MTSKMIWLMSKTTLYNWFYFTCGLTVSSRVYMNFLPPTTLWILGPILIPALVLRHYYTLLKRTYVKCSWDEAHCCCITAGFNTAHAATTVGVVMERLDVSGRWRSSGGARRSDGRTAHYDLRHARRFLLRVDQKTGQKTSATTFSMRWWRTQG